MRLIQVVEECCPVLGSVPLGEREAEQVASAFKAIADAARLRILSLIASRPDREACVCILTGPLGLSQPTVSHHLRVLHEAGLLQRERRGTWAFYRIAPGALDVLRRALTPAAGVDDAFAPAGA